jgi:hypothetical protein
MRPRSLARLRAVVDGLLVNRRQTPIAEVTAAEIREFITGNGWAPATMKGYLGDVKTLLAWATRNKYLRDDPALAVDPPRLEDKPPGILTPAQCGALLAHCRAAEPTLLPTVSLCLLAGLRPEEARRLEWANVGEEFIEVPGHKAKTRRRRLVPLTAQLQAWLELGGELVRPADATAFFAMLPDTVKADPAAAAVPAKRPKPGCNRACLPPINATLLGGLFAHGERSLTRAEAARELCIGHGYAHSTAASALSPAGRFKAHLREGADGLLTWNPFPLANPGKPAATAFAGASAGDCVLPLPSAMCSLPELAAG